MALLFADSFDHYSTTEIEKKWTTRVSAIISAGTGRGGTASLQLGNLGQGVVKTLTPTGAVCIVGFRIKLSALPASAADIIRITDGSTVQMSLSILADGTLRVYRGGNLLGTVLSTSVIALSTGTFFHLAFKVSINNSTGSYEVKVDDLTAIAGSGVDTQESAAAQWTSVRIGTINTLGSTTDIDDVYICDGSGSDNNDFLGDVQVEAKVASAGNGSNTDFTPSTGSDHGALVDENPPNTSDYNSSETAGQRDTYNFAALSSTGTVKGVQVSAYVSADRAGVRSTGIVVREGSTNYDAAGELRGADWIYQRRIYETRPSNGAAWAISDIDAAEFGLKVTA